MLVAVKACCDRIEDLKPVGELLGESNQRGLIADSRPQRLARGTSSRSVRPRAASSGFHRVADLGDARRGRCRAGSPRCVTPAATSSHVTGVDTVASGRRPHGVDARQRPAPRVLVVVDEHAPLRPLGHAVLRRHQRRMPRRELHGQRLGERPDHLLLRPAHDRHVDVQPFGAARLHQRLHAERLERVAHDRAPPRAPARTSRRRRDRDRSAGSPADRRRRTVAYHWFRSMQPRLITHSSDGTSSMTGKVDDALRAVIDRAGADPRRPRRRRALHEEERPGGAVRIPLHHHRAVADVRQQHRRDVGVVLNQVAFGDPELRPERLAQIREPDLASRDGQRRVVDVGRGCSARRTTRRDYALQRLAASADAGRDGRRRRSARSRARCRRRRSEASARRGSCRRGRRTPAETPGGRRRSAAAPPRTCPTRCCRAARPRSRGRSRRARRGPPRSSGPRYAALLSVDVDAGERAERRRASPACRPHAGRRSA